MYLVLILEDGGMSWLAQGSLEDCRQFIIDFEDKLGVDDIPVIVQTFK